MFLLFWFVGNLFVTSFCFYIYKYRNSISFFMAVYSVDNGLFRFHSYGFGVFLFVGLWFLVLFHTAAVNPLMYILRIKTNGTIRTGFIGELE